MSRPSSATHAEILRFFDGLELLEPGLVQVHQRNNRPLVFNPPAARAQPSWPVPFSVAARG